MIFLLGMTVSCKKKYPDGPLFSFSSKLKRVSSDWVLTAAIINGEGKMSYPGFATCQLNITEDKGYAAKWEERGQELNALGTWKWQERKKYISFSTDLWFYKLDATDNLVINTFNNSQLTATTYRIIKLTEERLWMENNTPNGGHVELHFKSVN